MAKRFYNTSRIEEDWYIDLSLKHRELLRYCECKCDGAGIFSFNAKIASTYIGEKVTDLDLGFIPVSKLENGKYFIVGFCLFQNGILSEKSPAHKPIFKTLVDNEISEETLSNRLLNRVSDTLQEEEIEKEEEKEIEKAIPEMPEFLAYCKEVLLDKYLPLEFSLKAKYEAWVEAKWKDGNGAKIKNWKTKIKNTIPFLKPMQQTGTKTGATLSSNWLEKK